MLLQWVIWGFCVAGGSARDIINGAPAIEPRGAAVAAAAVGVRHKQGNNEEVGVDDGCGGIHKPRGSHDCSACEAHLRSGVPDSKPSASPAHHRHHPLPTSKHPPPHACHQLHAYDM